VPASPLSAYANRRMAVLVALGFASGLPSVLVADTLQAWMKQSGADITTIGLYGYVGLPYALKFAWAPLMDRYVPPLLGRRRGWLLLTQVAVALAIAAMAFSGPSVSLAALAATALCVSFLSASQDIVSDAYRTDVLPVEELGAGAAVFTTGYRVGMIASGGGALILAGSGVSWPWVYGLAAMAMSVGVVATLCAPEPSRHVARPPSLAAAVKEPLSDLLSRPAAWTMLVFVVIFKLPDVIAVQYTTPFLLDSGYALGDIGEIRGVVGVLATIVGAIAGGALVARAGLRRSLWTFGVLHAVSNFGYWALSRSRPDLYAMTSAVVLENFCVGLAAAGFMAFLMSQCDARFSASQYALLTSLMAATKYVAGPPCGFIAQHVGWSWFFAGAAVTGVPSLFLIPRLRLPGDAPPT
jgi:PAT family beta-lactamase induction signal transducer AmpG